MTSKPQQSTSRRRSAENEIRRDQRWMVGGLEIPLRRTDGWMPSLDSLQELERAARNLQTR